MDKLIVYSTPTCTKCKILKDKLKKEDISFTECQDVDKMIKMGIKAVPMMKTNIGSDKLLDFNESMSQIEIIKTIKELTKDGESEA